MADPDDRLLDAAEAIRQARIKLNHLRLRDADGELASNIYELCNDLEKWEDQLTEEANDV